MASSCIDVSDGLSADLAHIAQQSEVSMVLRLEDIPISASYQHYLRTGGNYDLALIGGDDYQLAFTANQSNAQKIQKIAEQTDTEVTKIGQVVAPSDAALMQTLNGKTYHLKSHGYQHFAEPL